MKLFKGIDMFGAVRDLEGPQVICVTTNGVVTKDGLVMGAGAAKGARDAFPWLPLAAAKLLINLFEPIETYTPDLVFEYGLQNVGFPDRLDRQIFLVQTKRHWKEKSDPELVEEALMRMGCWCADGHDGMADGPSAITYHLNFPAIGRGGLPRSMVLPWVEKLPDNVFVYEL